MLLHKTLITLAQTLQTNVSTQAVAELWFRRQGFIEATHMAACIWGWALLLHMHVTVRQYWYRSLESEYYNNTRWLPPPLI